MQITRQADYAVRAVLYLSGLESASRAPTSHIAREKQIPPSFLAKIVSQLSVAGVVQTSRGARGGVSLARPAEDISLLEVIEAIDGPITLNECVVDASSCAFGEDCPVHSIWCETHETLVSRLRATNFEALANADSNGRVN
jgi:Rrf2 family protein